MKLFNIRKLIIHKCGKCIINGPKIERVLLDLSNATALAFCPYQNREPS